MRTYVALEGALEDELLRHDDGLLREAKAERPINGLERGFWRVSSLASLLLEIFHKIFVRKQPRVGGSVGSQPFFGGAPANQGHAAFLVGPATLAPGSEAKHNKLVQEHPLLVDSFSVHAGVLARRRSSRPTGPSAKEGYIWIGSTSLSAKARSIPELHAT